MRRLSCAATIVGVIRFVGGYQYRHSYSARTERKRVLLRDNGQDLFVSAKLPDVPDGNMTAHFLESPKGDSKYVFTSVEQDGSGVSTGKRRKGNAKSAAKRRQKKSKKKAFKKSKKRGKKGKKGRKRGALAPSFAPTPLGPTQAPVVAPSQSPSVSQSPTTPPTIAPTSAPVIPTDSPTVSPVDLNAPTQQPTAAPGANTFDTTVDVTNVAANLQAAFMDAAVRWDQVIVGDVPDITVTENFRNAINCTGGTVPEIIDDVFICATIVPIDGIAGVLGSAGPSLVRTGDKVIPFAGNMRFDSDDIMTLVADGSFPNVILHEMGHVVSFNRYRESLLLTQASLQYGIGTLWQMNGLLGDDQCSYLPETRATEEYRQLSGCATDVVPVEADGDPGTRCSHWDEQCYQGELMTGISSGALELSRTTVATLEDLGYSVNYEAADAFPVEKLDSSCRCDEALILQDAFQKRGDDSDVLEESSERREKEVVSVLERARETKINGPRRRRRLSTEGHDVAVDFGLQVLLENSAIRESLSQEEQAMYVGDLVVTILYQEEGHLYGVDVFRDTEKVNS